MLSNNIEIVKGNKQMNNEFSSYVTSAVFNITMSKRQISALCLVHADESVKAGQFKTLREITADFRTLNALRSRGLIEWRCDTKTSRTNGPHMTRAGILIIELLKEAGLYPQELSDYLAETA